MTDKYINADRLKSMLEAKADMALGTPKQLYNHVAAMVDRLPAADVVSMETHASCLKALQALAKTDVVQVIRCKDCRYYNRRWGCHKLEINVSANDYCFLAEPAVSDNEVILPDEK